MTKEEEIIKLREELDDTKHQLFRALREREELAQSLHKTILFGIVLGFILALFKPFFCSL